jgi:hypothetical protein
MQPDVDDTRSAAVDREYHWRPIATCPSGVKVQLINRRYGVAVYGTYTRKDCWWTHWAPLPVFNKESDRGQRSYCGVRHGDDGAAAAP